MRLTEKNSNRRTFHSQRARHQELEKRLCDYMDNKRQYGYTVTSEMCQLKALAIPRNQASQVSKLYCVSVKQQPASGCQPGKQRGSVRHDNAPTMHSARMPHCPLTCVRLTVVTAYVQIDVFLQANLYFSQFRSQSLCMINFL